MPIVVRVDVRESAKTIATIRGAFKEPDYVVEVDMLATGDVCVGNSLAVEHKTPPDFWNSVKDSRIKQQAIEMKEAYTHAFIVVSGSLTDCMNAAGASGDNIPGVVASLSARYGVPVLFADGQLDKLLVRLVEKTTDGKVVEYNPIRKSATPKQVQEHLLASLPGVGPTRAKALLAYYGSPLTALNSIESWTEVSGIGRKTVDGVKQQLGL